LYIDPANPEELRTKLIQILTDDALRQSLSQRIIARAQELTWDKAAQRVIQLFDEL
jgi:glycosyltransferase involved in cell wall biosynthesis